MTVETIAILVLLILVIVLLVVVLVRRPAVESTPELP